MNPKHPLCCGSIPTVGLSRRQFLNRFGMGLGGVALGGLLSGPSAIHAGGGLPSLPHFPAKAKRIIYLFQSGGPAQMELFDHKPLLKEMNGEPLPDSVRKGQRLTGMSANQSILPIAGSLFEFKQYGECGAWVSDLMPHTAGVVDDLCFIKSMYTEAINHDPAITFLQTGSQLSGRPCIGSWLTYGLGSDNEDLPAFVVLLTKGKGGQPLYSRLWGSGFLPSRNQGVQLRAGKDPVLYLSNPGDIGQEGRRLAMNRLRDLHEHRLEQTGDTALEERIAQYEMAFRMQTSVPEVTDLSDEPEEVFELYGPDSRTPGTYAANCLLARRLAERGVKTVQLYHRDWDHHGDLPGGIRRECGETDQPTAALIKDLKQRGMLEDTLVIWGGEFGRTNYSQGRLSSDNYGRDHHPRCFTVWMAGGGVKPGITYGETCEFGYNVVKDGVHVHDFHATLLHLLGVDHERLTYHYMGRDFRLTDVHGKLVKGILA